MDVSSCAWLATVGLLLASPVELVKAQSDLFTTTNLTTTIIVDSTTAVVNAETLAIAAAFVSTSSAAEVALFQNEAVQLTDSVVANLTNIALVNASLFDFGSNETAAAAPSACKVFPGDAEWPSDLVWSIFDLLLGGSLIKTIPLAAPCYSDWPAVENAAECAYITDEWTNSTLHMDNPTSVMWPLYEGRTCLPPAEDPPYDNCTLGGYPSYAVNISNVAQIQLAVNFARNANLRLVVKNTGHDFNGKSAGGGALSIWTHHLKDITYLPTYTISSYSGPAVKLGSGIQAFEIYAAAKSFGVSVVGGEGRTVGVGGGYVAGGGHSPLSSLYGMAADQVLAIEVVTPDGRFVTVTEELNSDLFWALRGGGGSTFGVMTSLVVKTHPVLTVSTMTFTFATGSNVSSNTFWEGVRAYFDYFVDFTDAGTYAYFSTVSTGTDAYEFAMRPFFAPNMTESELITLAQPWLTRLSNLGISIIPVITQYDNFYDAWWDNFPLEEVGIPYIRTASRLFPKSNWANETSLNATFDAIRTTIEYGGTLLAFNTRAAPNDGTDNSVNPAWRETCLHAILGTFWSPTANLSSIVAAATNITYNWMQLWRDVSPNSGAYMSEADILEPHFEQAFYGTNYPRLYALKQQYDPTGLFYAPTAVGSENWYITDQVRGLPTQDGRLCLKGTTTARVRPMEA